MNTVEYSQMAKYEEGYWWHLGRIHIVRRQLRIIAKKLGDRPIRILNIGCGTGGTVSMLEEFGEVVNVDTEPLALKFLKQRGFKNAVLVKGLELPFKDGEFDAVVAMDVLEHIEDETTALQEWHRVLRKGGEVLITVPAYQWLWSGHDEALHHFRRYTRSRLKRVASNAGFTKRKLSYMITFSLPLVVGFRFKNKLSGKKITEETSYVELPKPVNNLFTFFLKLEAWFLGKCNLPFGTSVLCRAEKK